jgi:hypothetical protein
MASSYNSQNFLIFMELSFPQKFGYSAFSCFTLMKSVQLEDERRGSVFGVTVSLLMFDGRSILYTMAQ